MLREEGLLLKEPLLREGRLLIVSVLREGRLPLVRRPVVRSLLLWLPRSKEPPLWLLWLSRSIPLSGR